MALNSGDITFRLLEENPILVTIGFGQRPPHDHDHGHDDEDHDEDHEDEDHDDDHDEDHDDDHDEDHEDEHGHGGGYEEFEEFRVMEEVLTIGLRHDRNIDDFNQLRFSAFGGTGESEIGEDSWFAGAGVEYEWRENGLEPGGSSLRWRTEFIRFLADNGEHDHEDEDHDDDHGDVDHDDDHDEEEESMASISSWGISSEVLYIMNDRFHPFVRIDHVSGSDVIEAEEWTRYTAGATFPLVSDPAGVYLKLQANADDRGDESEESFWAQLGFSWGGAEVR